jgi:hypothetical protein
MHILLTEETHGPKTVSNNKVRFHIYAYIRFNMKLVKIPSDFQIYITQILPPYVNAIFSVGIYRMPRTIHQKHLHSRYESIFNTIEQYLVNKSVCVNFSVAKTKCHFSKCANVFVKCLNRYFLGVI